TGAIVRGKRLVSAVRKLLGQPTPCVGRDAEIALVETILAQCAEEPVARAVVVTATPGMGKSRLRYELLRRLQVVRDLTASGHMRLDDPGAADGRTPYHDV